ncbi:MAG: peptide chain release factor N(5)-glutamine methyltransferase [Mariniphaga sp.]|nr:peptide chain release factor N(5)-glutamine methyltransferase [Mariniphaga sp.]MDD4225219.1 peptide chain release factor N(5)-glutamine methyltransferase [Mariniphaga sp.]MDD4426168.1 peptide chain release factor N(5)-glutamine methyltransferase [Mariniphaga sp.]
MEATIQYIRQELSGFYPETEIKAFERLILEHVYGLSFTDQVVLRKQKLDHTCRKTISEIILRLKTYEPIQYILGETEFGGLTLNVTPSVLIPRPETEEFVEWIVATDIPENSKILDIGTGSGCIALSLKKMLPESQVSAIDISADTLLVASQNGQQNGLSVDFFQADIVHWENYTWKKYDLIVSNPPYVRESEKQAMSTNVLSYEPPGALYVPDSDPLIFYKRIAEFALHFLNDSGYLFFEINENLGNKMINLLKKYKLQQIELKKDIFGKDRMICCRK